MRRRSLPLNPFEHAALASLYLQARIATDRYMHRRAALQNLTRLFNDATDRNDSPEDVLHYMQTKRRTIGGWPTLDGNHIRLPVLLGDLVDLSFVPVIMEIYVELGLGPERFTQDRVAGRRLEQRFLERTGVRLPAFALATAMIELRKAGQLPTLPNQPHPFTDFDAAEGM